MEIELKISKVVIVRLFEKRRMCVMQLIDEPIQSYIAK